MTKARILLWLNVALLAASLAIIPPAIIFGWLDSVAEGIEEECR